jgi:hypothetical protein
MINRDSIAEKLGVERLEDYIINEYLIGKSEGGIVVRDSFKNSQMDLEEIKSEEVKIAHVLSELIKIKAEFGATNNSYFTHLTEEVKDYNLNKSLDVISERDELNNLAKYILDIYDFKKTSSIVVEGQLLEIRKNSRRHHITLEYISKSKTHFNFLNDKCKVDRYTWNWLNFENGLISVLGNYTLEKLSLESNYKLKSEAFEIHKKSEVDDLKSEIKDLKREIDLLNKEIDMRTNFHNKYYYDSQIMISNTYVGDNLPFLFNLYNFLKTNNLFSYGWSYFYSCMVIGNNEMISLKSSKKQNFIGRIFFHFKDNLILHYKDESFKFLQSKFLIN